MLIRLKDEKTIGAVMDFMCSNDLNYEKVDDEQKEVRVERLVKSGIVNGNNILLEEKSFEEQIKIYLKTNGVVRIDHMTIDERNELISKRKLYPSLFNVVGQAIDFDEDTVLVKLLKDIPNIQDYRCEFFVKGSKIESNNEKYNVYKVLAIETILLVKR